MEDAGLFTVFAESFQVVAFDQRGLGRSAFPEAPYTMADLASNALALADHLEWEHFRLAGVSFGGMVAQEIAVTAPHRIDRLALLCTAPGGAGGSSFPLHTLGELDPDQRIALSAQILDTRFTLDWLADHEDDRALAMLLQERSTMDKTEKVRKGEEFQLEARCAHDVYDRLPGITCPTLVASGRYDGIAPLVNGLAIAQQIPKATMRLYDGGHLFFIQDPHAFPEILAFLSE